MSASGHAIPILVIDDDPTSLELVVAVLAPDGYAVRGWGLNSEGWAWTDEDYHYTIRTDLNRWIGASGQLTLTVGTRYVSAFDIELTLTLGLTDTAYKAWKLKTWGALHDAAVARYEQIIAAKAQEEAMKHVLPFKQKQIEQRKLEAEADKTSRIKTAEGMAEARRIEASGEADSRRKLADAESYRVEQLGKVSSAQLERDGALISKHPLLIQKTLADKLSDKISVIIAPPPTSGGFIGAALVGNAQPRGAQLTATANAAANGSEEAQ